MPHSGRGGGATSTASSSQRRRAWFFPACGAAASPLSRRPAQPGPWGAAGRAQAQARGAGGVSIKYIAFQEKKNGHVGNAARWSRKSRADQ